MGAGYHIGSNFNPASLGEQQDLQSWLFKQPLDKIDEYAWQVYKPFYLEKPVNLLEYLYSPDYMGNLYYRNGKSAIYKYWVRVGCDLFPRWYYQPYSLLLASLAIGVGKSTFMNMISTYFTHLLGCLKNPAEFYGLLSTETIVMGFFSTTKDQLYQVNWPKFADSLAISPWFKKRLNLDEVEPKVRSLDLFNGFSIQIGSRVQHAIGRDVLIAMIDEGNQEVTSQQVEKNFNELMKRRESRFQNGLIVPGIVCVASSPQGPYDFIYRTIEQYRGDPTTYVLNDVSEWEVKEGAKHYCGKKFKVYLGDNKTQDPCILTSATDMAGIEQSRVREVPIEYYSEFKADLVGSIRDKLGLRSTVTATLFKSRSLISNACKLKNIFTKEVIDLDVFDTYQDIMQYVDLDQLQDLINTGIPVNIGLDYARTTDKFGFAIGYCMRVIQDNLYDRLYFIKGATSFKAKSKRGIPSKALEDFIDKLTEMGLQIRLISSDRPGLVTLQNLIIKGFATEYQSVDKPKDAYDVLKALILSEKIELPLNELMVTEMANLQDTGQMYDHPEKMIHGDRTVVGSKDCSDAVCQVAYRCFLQTPDETSTVAIAKTQEMLQAVRQQQYIQQLRQQLTQPTSQQSFSPNFYMR